VILSMTKNTIFTRF